MWEAVWGGCEPQPWHNHIILTPQVTQSPKIWAKLSGYNCVRLILLAYGQHINVLKHFVYVQYGGGQQFEVAISLNHDIMTSFWLHKWPRTPKSDPSWVGITVIGCYHMPMDSISMCSNTLYMSNMDARISLRLLSATTMTSWHHFDSTSDPEPQNMSQVG
jgi:hypothetical protein